jgi:signal transduction histidine kinase
MMSMDSTNRSHRRDILTVGLLSNDPKLVDLLTEVLKDIASEEVEILALGPEHEQARKADIVICDTDDMAITANHRGDSGSANEQLFLLSRTTFRDSTAPGRSSASITLLKPISRKTLQIFLEHAVARAMIKRRVAAPPMIEAPAASNDRDLLQCLLQANLKLQEYDQDRTNFLARAVHDFRAPLMAADGYCSILLQQELGPVSEAQLQLMERIQRSLRKLNRMASAMLELSVGKHLTRGPNLTEFSIEACVTRAVQEVEPIARSKRIELSMKLNPPEEPLCFDPEQVEQVLVNLLENSCKFTSKGGAIEVSGDAFSLDLFSNHLAPYRGSGPNPEATPGSVNVYRVDVSDSGAGIAPEHLESIFEEYTSYGGPLDRSGGGLGLASCRMTLQGHGGRIWAENHGEGARLSFLLPLGNAHTRKALRAFSQTRLGERTAS